MTQGLLCNKCNGLIVQSNYRGEAGIAARRTCAGYSVECTGEVVKCRKISTQGNTASISSKQVLGGRMSRRQFLVRASVFGLSVSAAGSLLAACGGSGTSTGSASPAASGTPKPGGTVKVTALAPLSALDPVTMYQTGDISTVEQICEYLAWVEKDLTLRPVLAESWSPDPSGKVWTFKLRQGVTFSDGSAFGAEDVVTTFDRLVDPKSGSGALSALKGILSPGGTQKVDDYTVAFNLDTAFADFPYLVSSGNYNSVILPRNFAGDFIKSPVGTGPFTLVTYRPKRAPH